MKTFMLAAIAAGATLFAAMPAEAQVNHRQWRQQERIYQGYRNGDLTRAEYRRLQRDQRHIARYEARSRWDGRGLSWRERERLDRMQDRASRDIRYQRNDWQDRDRYRRW